MTTLTIKPILLLIILTVLGAFCNAQTTLGTNGRLVREQSLINGAYRLTMQTDCNLVIYDNGNPIWATNTAGRGNGCSVVMRDNGDLALYLSNNQPIWLSNTARGIAGYYLVLQSDRNLVIYAPGGTPIWASNTQRRMSGNMANQTMSNDHMVTKHA
ncbi:hypothetical protein ACHQM5_029565 [Ranunculus cassubicifolius]